MADSPNPAPHISVIIPNWNGAEHLPVCLESLRAQTLAAPDSQVQFKTIVVDNASTDGSQDLLAQYYPEVQLIQLPENRGFTGACNAGFRAAQGEILVLLNNDTETHPRWLEEVITAFSRHPQAGSVASRMMLFDRRDVFHTAGDFFRVDGTPGNRGVWQKDTGQYDREEYVFSACGGSAAYRRVMLDEIGLLDDAFYFSSEDLDLGWRAQLAGWRCVYAPGAVVYHKLKATGGDELASYYNGRNLIYIIAKNYPTSLLRRFWPLIIKTQWRITREALHAWRGKAARARLRGQLAGLVGVVRMLRARKKIMKSRRVTDDYLLELLTPVDSSP
ncbi:MAG: glycosyltransferase family 2 protein [Anaerolineales bacterium]|nr:glycosyltransferase family 2 protein [Anaerolineales bacterium]